MLWWGDRDDFLGALHYNEENQWDDLRFGQEILKFIDLMSTKLEAWCKNYTNRSSCDSAQRLKNRLQRLTDRLGLRLALTTLHEADA